MHEYSLMQALMDKTIEIAAEHGHPKVERIKLQIGELQHIVPDILEFAFEVMAKGTIAETADLVWDVVPVKIKCQQCHTEFEPHDVFWVCPQCESSGGEIKQGDEFILESITFVDPAGEL
ncbi:MAG: hydrogenase maturation nickel metallochaperone HypA [Gemmatimonadetes bacterium]|nr:MAG: hydrogenase maturation nickel metallochaperone HypA [Gemmatimonadota bacterium]